MTTDLRNAIAIAIEIGYHYGSSRLSREEGRFEETIELLNSHLTDVLPDVITCIRQHLMAIDTNLD